VGCLDGGAFLSVETTVGKTTVSLAGVNPTIPILEYVRSDKLSSSRVWVATTSGIAQQGMLNQNLAYVFINGLGLYVRSILLQVFMLVIPPLMITLC
jgi:hypothetical protein